MGKLAIIGASGHGKVVADVALANDIKDIIFYDDRWPELKQSYGFPVVGDTKAALHSSESYDFVIVAIGSASVREDLQGKLHKVSPALIHPTAVISKAAVIGKGSVVMPGAIVNADAIIGEGVIINSGAIVEHDCIVGNYSHICPSASLAGGVIIGDFSWVGIGSSVIQQTKIGDYVTVGAGAIVLKDIPDRQTVVGVPAKQLEK
ncbi:acetyltransferase [Kangiella sp.]|uniref:acetyltransferase n=1 Tax=Kangiella sp. TaxID=1920245 RepID=UPI003A925A16